MEASEVQQYEFLSAKLIKLGYWQGFGIDSYPLVKQITADLLQTTVSLRSAKEAQSRAENEVVVLRGKEQALQRENARLIKENNALHLHCIETGERADSVSKNAQTELRHLSSQLADVRAINAQFIHQLAGLEKESELKSERIEALLSKNLASYVQTPNGSKQPIGFHPQRLTMTSPVEPSNDLPVPKLANITADHTKVMHVSDQRIRQLMDQLEVKSRDLTNLKEELTKAKDQIHTRNQEITRLSELAEQGLDVKMLQLKQTIEDQSKSMEQLNMQVNHIQGAKARLEEKLASIDPTLEDQNRVLQQRLADVNARQAQTKSELEAAYDRMAGTLPYRHEAEMEIKDHTINQPSVHSTHSASSVSCPATRLVQIEKDLDASKKQCTRLKAANENLRYLYRQVVKNPENQLKEGYVQNSQEGERQGIIDLELVSAMEELEQCQQECTRLHSVLDEASQRQRDMEKASDRLAQENSHMMQETEECTSHIRELEAMLRAKEEEVCQVADQLNEVESDRQYKERLASQAQSDLARARDALEEAKGREEGLRQRQREMEKELVLLQEAKAETPRLRGSLAALLNEKDDWQAQVDTANQHRSILEKEVKALQARVDELTIQLTGSQVELDRLSSLDQLNVELSARLKVADFDCETARKKVNDLTGALAKAKRDVIEAVETNQSKNNQQQDQMEARVEQVVKERDKMHKAYQALKMKYEKMQEKATGTQDTLEQVQDKLSKQEDIVLQLQEALVQMQTQCQDDYLIQKESQRKAALAEAALGSIQQELHQLQADNRDLKKALSASRETNSTFNQTRLDQSATVDTLVSENTTLHNALDAEVSEKKPLYSRMQALENKISTLEGQLAASKSDVKAAEDKALRLETQSKTHQEDIKRLGENNIHLQAGLMTYQTKQLDESQALKEKSRQLLDLEYQRAKWLRSNLQTQSESSSMFSLSTSQGLPPRNDIVESSGMPPLIGHSYIGSKNKPSTTGI